MHIVSVGLSLLNWVNISNIFVTHSLKLKLKVNGQSTGSQWVQTPINHMKPTRSEPGYSSQVGLGQLRC